MLLNLEFLEFKTRAWRTCQIIFKELEHSSSVEMDHVVPHLGRLARCTAGKSSLPECTVAKKKSSKTFMQWKNKLSNFWQSNHKRNVGLYNCWSCILLHWKTMWSRCSCSSSLLCNIQVLDQQLYHSKCCSVLHECYKVLLD